eukprot:CAMPEP_0116930718 /NCGR_PEP_ID=MMETSP0467-20121206/27372_1 /TAXON_ID=283647 /ORGANISM="Mesodinium pulex, Strain SPMC105" /LENGTH=68 /DNA_ID=CAMNT_0004610989 /DNA_START=1117 /DNA_END=1323 /DNA_ORIENTATION=-
MIMDEPDIRKMYIKDLEETKDMIDEYNKRLREVIDDEGNLRISERVKNVREDLKREYFKEFEEEIIKE